MARHLLNSIPFTLLLLFAVFKIRTAAAEEIRASVTHISGNILYLDAGTAKGLRSGQAGEIRRSGTGIAQIEIISTAEQSASSRVIEQTVVPQIGDTAIVVFQSAIPNIPALPSTPPPPVKSKAALIINRTRQPRPSAHRLSGRIGVQHYTQDDRTNFNYDYSQLSVVVRLTMARLLESHYTLNVRLRSRRNFWPQTARSDRREWDNRIYEVSLGYSDPGSWFEYQAGRILPAQVSGIGYIDGAYGRLKISPSIAVGGFGGTKPNLKTTEFQTRTTLGGAFTALNTGQAEIAELDVVAAVAGEYTDSEISREFVYQQASLTYGTRLSAFQSTEININRGWKREVEREPLKLANTIANIRWTIFNGFTVSSGYDGFANYRTWENHDTPDSLFDEALRQGYRMGLEIGMPFGIRIDLRETIRDDAASDKLQQSASGSINTHRLLGGRLGLGVRYNSFENRFTIGHQPSGSLYFTVWNGAEFSLNGGRTSYHYTQSEMDTSTDWIRGSFDFGLGRRYYCTISGEVYRGDSENTVRAFFETGIRI